MNEPNDPLLLDHEIDGIRELDNNLPTWWLWLFYGAVAFSVVYLCYYHVFARGDLARHGQMATEYAAEMKAGAAAKVAAMSKFESSIATLQPSTDEAVLASGRTTFANLCAPCHRVDGGGLVGPNLTDDFWIHGANFSDNVSVIWNGVPAKGMVTWKNSLRPDQIYAVASYIYTLRGSKLLTPGKPPENQTPAPSGPSDFE
ncbi:MAG TPA: cbb3-type cytochrome c oxidase N-terminal domain-containing protein [Verrucomicrobiae bacterium]|nr:cbb3-type cytochrome c oxidase N-terminal domain-containing protein [Verrucomicrobiae bacterium]